VGVTRDAVTLRGTRYAGTRYAVRGTRGTAYAVRRYAVAYAWTPVRGTRYAVTAVRVPGTELRVTSYEWS